MSNSDFSQFQFRANKVMLPSAFEPTVNLYLLDHKNHAAVDTVLIRVVPPGEVCPSAMNLTVEQAQQLADELLAAGIRQKDNPPPPPPDFKAVLDHVADLRKIAFKLLKMGEQA